MQIDDIQPFFRNEIIQGIFSTDGNLASVDDTMILTIGSFKNLESKILRKFLL